MLLNESDGPRLTQYYESHMILNTALKKTVRIISNIGGSDGDRQTLVPDRPSTFQHTLYPFQRFLFATK